jgi:hypothetical protein
MLRPVAGLEAGTMEHVITRWFWEQYQAAADALLRQQWKETKINTTKEN